MSGGGHRAALFGLGPLLYLADADKNANVTSIASVSGGSLTNGYVAQEIDYSIVSAIEFRNKVAAPLVRVITSGGTLWAYWGTWAFLVCLGVLMTASVGIWFTNAPLWLRIGGFAGVVLLLGWVSTLRGRACGRSFKKALFSHDGSGTRLSQIHKTIDHVICATDLHAGEHVYFSGGFVCAYRFGWGTPSDLYLHQVVQASAALPGAFPPTWLPTSHHSFRDPWDPAATKTKHMALVDGGVYDNMGDQWGSNVTARNTRWAKHEPNLHEPDELIVVNSSAALAWTSSLRRLRLPFVGEVLSLLRDKDILYDNGTSVRRHALVASFDLAAMQGEGFKGCLVHIASSPFKVIDRFRDDAYFPERRDRALAAEEALGATRDAWVQRARDNSEVKTSLSRLGPDVSASLICHGYVLAMINLHVLHGYPLLPVPELGSFTRLTNGGRMETA